MSTLDTDLSKLKDDVFNLIREHGLNANRFHLTLVMSKKEFDKLARDYSQFTKEENNSPLIILSGTNGDLQWTIQILFEIELQNQM